MYSSRSTGLSCFIVMFAVLLAMRPATAETVRATVTYIAAAALYVDAGTAQGVQKGDSGDVVEGGKVIARIQVEFVAGKSASCKVLESTGAIRAGDSVVLEVAAKAVEAPPDTVAKPVTPSELPLRATEPKKTKKNAPRFRGSVGLQVLGQTSRDNFDYNYYEPGLVMRGSVENLFGGGPTLSVRMNLRRDYHNHASPDVPQKEWLSRVYEVSLTYDAPESRVKYSVGRMLSNRLAGIGYIDGARLGVQMADHFEVGVFGGTQPDLRTTDVRTSTTKGGAYAAYRRGTYGSGLFNATLAAAGEYFKGQISREFVYEQTDYAFTERFSAYQSAEINVNRGWRKTAGVSTLEMTNFLLNLRYSPVRSLAVTASYDNRTPYRTYDTRTIADSLFDTALQQGYRLGLSLRLPGAMQADADGGIRTSRSDKSSTRSGGAGLSTHNLLNQRVFLGGRITAFTSPFSKGYQPTVTISRLVFNRVTAGIQAGWDNYTLKTVNQSVRTNWQRASLDWLINRLLYGSASYQLYRGGGLNSDNYSIEVGCRF
jgi:hypothetical protein